MPKGLDDREDRTTASLHLAFSQAVAYSWKGARPGRQQEWEHKAPGLWFLTLAAELGPQAEELATHPPLGRRPCILNICQSEL